MGRCLRIASNLKIRQPLSRLVLVTRDAKERSIIKKMGAIIAEELNVKEIAIEEDESNLVSYEAKANFKILGKKLGKHMKEVASKIQSFSSETINSILEGKNQSIDYSEGSLELSSEELVIQRNENADMKVLNEGQLTVAFDTKISHELLLEGIARDLVRGVQNLRKEKDFDVTDRIILSVEATDIVKEAIKEFNTYITKETLANSIELTSLNEFTEIQVGEYETKIEVQKVD